MRAMYGGWIALLAFLTWLAAAVDAELRKPKKGSRPRLVSRDLLADLPGAQPGTQAEPYVHADPEDPKRLLAAWQENRFVGGGAQALVVARSRNGGRSWTERALPGLTFVDGGLWELAADPWVEFGPGGAAHYAALVGGGESTTAIVVSTSIDGGVSWGPPVPVTRDEAPNFADKPALTADVHAESPHRGNVYVAWDVNVLNDAGDGFTHQDIYLSRSTDGGSTFESPRLVRAGLIGGGAIPRVGADGTVYLVWTGEGSISRWAIYFSKSSNGGVRWTRPAVLADVLVDGVEGIRDGASLASFAVDPDADDLFIVWQDGRFNGIDQIAMIRSRDRGRSWTQPRMVADVDQQTPAFTPSVAVNERGEVAVGYYALEPPGVDYYVRVSEDGGESFDRTLRMTRRTFDIDRAALASGGRRFLGDYVGLTGAGKRFQAVWVSTRRATPSGGGRQPDVWSARTR